jgi:hypothetical protein
MVDGLETIDPIRIEQIKRKILKQLAWGKVTPKQLEMYNKWLSEHVAIDKQEGYNPYAEGKIGVRRKRFCDKNQQQFAFSYFKEKKGLDCEYPIRFNGKEVGSFDGNHRPIGIDGVDLIDDYWASIDGGFVMYGDNINGLKKWASKVMKGAR